MDPEKDPGLGNTSGGNSFRRFQSAVLPSIIWILLALGWYGWRTFQRIDRESTLTFTVMADGASVPFQSSLDGHDFRPGDHAGIGRHHLEIQDEDIEPLGSNFMVWSTRTDLGQINAKRARGDLEVTVDPMPAIIEITGQGVTERHTTNVVHLRQIPVGQYQARAIFTGYTDLAEVRVKRSETARLTMNAPIAAVEITSEPGGATVQILSPDNSREPLGGSTPLKIPQFHTGTYAVNLAIGDYHQRRTFVVERGRSNRLAVTFEYGGVNLTSQPADATVTDGGKTLGQTPLTLTNVIPGEHHYQIALADYRPVETTLAVKPSEVATVSVVLDNLVFEREMKAVRGTSGVEEAINHVNAALVAVPGSTEALALKLELEIKREEQKKLAVKEADERAAREKEDRKTRAIQLFRSITREERDDEYFPVHSWVFSKSLAEVRRAADSIPVEPDTAWNLQETVNEDGGSVLLRWAGKGKGHKHQHCLVLVSPLDEQATLVQAKFWDYVKYNPLNFVFPEPANDPNLVPASRDRLPKDREDEGPTRQGMFHRDLESRLTSALK